MRPHYPLCLLVGDRSSSYINFCQSLKFSTHCEYYLISNEAPFNLDGLVHMKWCPKGRFDIQKVCRNRQIFILDFTGRNFKKSLYEATGADHRRFNTIEFTGHELTPSILHSRNILEEKISLSLAKEFRRTNQKTDSLFKKQEVIHLDLFFDYSGEAILIGGTKSDSNAENAHHYPISIQSFQNLKALKVLQTTVEVKKNCILTLALERTTADTFRTIGIKSNNFSHRWNIHRALGVNIPLIFIQNFLKRKVTCEHLVDLGDIEISQTSKLIKYCFKTKNCYVDLDDTLIWSEQLKPIPEIKLAIEAMAKKNWHLVLLTRHQANISETLERAGIDEMLFNDIIRVENHQKKSAFVECPSIFIDNEFMERKDVRSTHGIPVMDLDQINFLSF